MTRVGLPKGVVKGRSLQLIERILGVPPDSGRLSHFDAGDFQFYLLKHRDIPRLIDYGHLDIGITSTEWLVESESKAHRIAKLDWCDCRVSFIRHQSQASGEFPPSLTCVSEFPRIARAYLRERGAVTHRLDYISGSSEALVPSLYDSCIDCVETGKTLAAHGLTEVDVIMHTSVEVISTSPTSECRAFMKYLE